MHGPKTVVPTPIVVLSNRPTFPDTDEFTCRIAKYTWQTAPLLQQWALQKPHPIHTMECFIFMYNSSLLSEEVLDTLSEVYTNVFVNIQ